LNNGKAINEANNPACFLGAVSNRFISHYKIESWGYSIFIMDKKGNAFARIYWYHDDLTAVYLDMLSVSVKIRRQGIGTELQEMREQIGRTLGATTSCLWVKEDTWMHDWYLRRGYEDWIKYEEEENSVWMRKSLFSNGF